MPSFILIHPTIWPQYKRSPKIGSPYAIGPLSCPVCLSVTLVYCCQAVAWIKMKHGMEVDSAQACIVLDRTQLPPPKKNGPCPLSPNGWID